MFGAPYSGHATIFLVSGRFASMVDTPGSAMLLLSVSSQGHLLFAAILLPRKFCYPIPTAPFVSPFQTQVTPSQCFVGQWAP